MQDVKQKEIQRVSLKPVSVHTEQCEHFLVSEDDDFADHLRHEQSPDQLS